MKWTNKEENLLFKIYPDAPTEVIKSSFNRTWDAVKIHANKLGIKRNVVDSRMGDVSSLLLDNNITYYWIGFIMADGSIDHEHLRLTVRLSAKDKVHLVRFGDYIHAEVKEGERFGFDKMFGYCSIYIQDKIRIKILIDKFNFKQNKTENPPDDISWMNDNLFLSFLTGFIDGDGCIRKVYKRKDSNLRIKNHRSWISVLEQFRIRLEKIFDVKIKSSKLNKQGYAELTLTNIKLLSLLKNKIKTLGIPYMERKWNLIDETLISRYETSTIKRMKIKKLLDSGMKNKDISKKLNISPSSITLVSKKCC